MTLNVRLLGQFSVTCEGHRLELRSRPAQLLLAYLALHAERPVPRDKLAGLLWPDASAEVAGKNLRQALWRLRRVIGDEHLEEHDRSLRLAPGRTTSDVAELQRADVSDRADALATAVGSYGGELLPGCYDEWIQVASAPLRATYDDRMARLLRVLAGQQRWDELRAWSERWIAHGTVPEPAYRGLMRAHGGIGDLAGVARAYQRCQAALREEIGVMPSRQTRALYHALMASDEAVPGRADDGAGPGDPVLPMPSIEFVGRTAVVEQRAVIKRPHDEVFASMLDPDHALLWRSNVFQYDLVAGSVGREGARVQVARKFGTEVVRMLAQVIEAEPGRWVRSRTIDSPIGIELETRFDDVSGGTRMTHRRTVEIPPAFSSQLGIPVMTRWYADDLRADVRKLKELLESS